MPLWIHLDGKQNYSPYTSIYVFKFCCCCLETWSKYVALDKVTVSMETRLDFYLWQWSFLWFSRAWKVSLISANLIRKMWLISTFPFLLLCSLTSFWIVCLSRYHDLGKPAVLTWAYHFKAFYNWTAIKNISFSSEFSLPLLLAAALLTLTSIHLACSWI